MKNGGGKKAIVIGASSGIGNALARIMSAKGYTLGITGRRRNLLDELSRALPSKNYVSDFDIVDTETAKTALEDLIEEMGGVDIIVINAGVGRQNPEHRLDLELLTVDVNVRGFTAMANVALHAFARQGGGQIVGVSSMLAIMGTGRAVTYSASKAYVSSYLESLRRYVQRKNMKILITDIKPGFVESPMTDENKDMFWVAPTDKAADQILDAIESGEEHSYITRRWRLIGWLMKLTPKFFAYKF